MIVILEGPDGSGKTTLHGKLVEKGFKCIPNLPREYPSQYCMYDTLFNNIHKNNVVIDRSFISELVYRICINDDREPNISLLDICKLLDKFDIKIIYCNTDSAFEDSIIRGDDYITNSYQHKYLSAVYDIIITMINRFTNTVVIKYNWKTDKVMNLIKKLA